MGGVASGDSRWGFNPPHFRGGAHSCPGNSRIFPLRRSFVLAEEWDTRVRAWCRSHGECGGLLWAASSRALPARFNLQGWYRRLPLGVRSVVGLVRLIVQTGVTLIGQEGSFPQRDSGLDGTRARTPASVDTGGGNLAPPLAT